MQETVLVVMSNFPDSSSAERATQALLGAHAVACVNLLPGVQSWYFWEGKIVHASETTLIAKTTEFRYREVEEILRAQHPYDLPEIIALPLACGWLDYLRWVAVETNTRPSVFLS